jgi:hypothetical protein
MKQQQLSPRRRVGVLPAGGVMVLLLAIAAWWLAGSPGGGNTGTANIAKPATDKPAQLPCSKVLGCAAGLAIEDASKQCQPQIEQLAAFAPRWTLRPGESIFIDFIWLQAEKGTITFLGKNAEFQDAAGRFGPVAYECDYDPGERQVLNVRAMTVGR